MEDATYHDGRNETTKKLEAIKFKALCNRDAVKYAHTCNALGLKSIEDGTLYDLGIAEILREQEEFSQLEKSVLKPRMESKNREKYKNLLKAGRTINFENIFVDIEQKRAQLINIMGYKYLNGLDGEKVETRTAKPERIGKAYRNCYIQAKKQNN